MSNLLDYSFEELRQLAGEQGWKPFRAQQIHKWIWQKGTTDFSRMSDLNKEIRFRLQERFRLEHPAVHTVRRSSDGTIKLLLSVEGGDLIETVLIPEEDHYTQCLSSQVGCALGCTFCSTGRMGFSRNLSSGEILGQILVARDYLARARNPLPLRNLVFMGMGEPLLNWPQVERALRIIRDDEGLGFSYRRTTLSTVGIPEPMRRFAESGLGSLAVSLHAPNQELREKLMPKAASIVSLEELIRVLEGLPLKPRQRVTLEYALIGGVNDDLKHARELNRIISSLRCKINLIAFNPDRDIPYRAPDRERVLKFEEFLRNKDKAVFLRKSKGLDIDAACGQLRNKEAACS
jgi:23S rRNA (adenine2503-C2)-methyltransferase